MDSVKTVHIWSDGPSSLFKNWYIAAALPWLQAKTNIQIDWNFFAASHGKGTVDSIGGTIKSLAGRRVVTGKSVITDSVSFFNAFNNESKVKVFHLPTAEIKNQISEKSIKVLLDNAKSLPGIFKAHFFKNTKGTVEPRAYRDEMIEIQDKIIKSQNKIAQNSALELKHGMFVIVLYEFATSSSKPQMVKKLLAVIIGVRDNVQIQYAKPVGGSKKRFKLIPNDKAVLSNLTY